MIDRLHAVLAERLALLPGEGRALSPSDLLQRDAPGGLQQPGRVSANRHCRLLATTDGWAALNLARPDDFDLIPALTHDQGNDWRAVESIAAERATVEFVDAAIALQLPAAGLGEAKPMALVSGRMAPPVRVLDLSALWGGPLCAGLLARAGAEVVRIEHAARRDPTPLSSPALDRFINAGKLSLVLDLHDARNRAGLRAQVLQSDVLVTSARPGALARLGLDRAELFAAHPRLVWAAITAHGWNADRVGFGDDCAVAGGLVRHQDGEPRFLGDALADPLTGLEAALAVCQRVATGGGGLLDLSMSGLAAAYAARIRG